MSDENFLFIIIIFLSVARKNSSNEKESIITIIIKSGYNKIYNNIVPSEMHINEESVEVSKHYQFNDDINIVKLVYKNTISSCDSMFKECESIIEMNLTYFNTSEVTDMYDISMDVNL